MMAKLTASLREAPATLPALVAMALFVVWATSQAGYPLTHWAPGGLIVLALLGIALGFVGLRIAEAPTPVKVALVSLAAYTALSFVSILWASVPGDAWEGANRTLLYLLVFALFACWPQHGRSAALLLGAWTLAMIGLAGFVLLHIAAAAHSPARLQVLFPEGRLSYPAEYVNANAAQWLIAFWPALLLARQARLHWALRGLFAGGAVLLAEVALLSVSRGALYATPVMLVLVFVLLPDRVRTFALLVPVAAGIAAATPSVLRVGERIEHGQNAATAVHAVIVAIGLTVVVVALVVAAGAAIESRSDLSDAFAKRVHRGVAVIALATLVLALVGGWVAAGNPVTRARHAWDTFKSGSGYAANSTGGNRLTSGLGSNRYDFYRVALDEFVAHPVGGIGVDNFQEQYLAHGRSGETPHYPHSVELRTLTETGVVGALLALIGLGAALVAGGRGLRRADPLGRAVAAAALAGFAYWVVHGSFDWFWEFAGLGAPAFAMVGLACALAPRHMAPLAAAYGVGNSTGTASSTAPATQSPVSQPSARRSPTRQSSTPQAAGASPGGPRGHGPRVGTYLAITAGTIVALAAAVSFTAPWLSQLDVQSAARIWPKAPATAYVRLNDAARLNPLSDEPYAVAGGIALRFGDLRRADHEFALALRHTPADAYATLERGAIASARGDRAGALALLERAARLNPHDSLTREVLGVVRRGERVDIRELNRSILLKARRLA